MPRVCRQLLPAAFLLAVAVLACSAFEIGINRAGGPDVQVSYPGATDSYYRAVSAGTMTGAWTIIDMQLGTEGAQSFTDDGALTAGVFRVYRIQEVGLTNALDADEDGIDDLYEINDSMLDGLDPADAGLDYDQDGYDNLTEYGVGTDIHASNPPPQIVITYPADGTVLP